MGAQRRSHSAALLLFFLSSPMAWANPHDRTGPRPLALKPDCATEIEDSLRSLALEPKPQLPAVIPASAHAPIATLPELPRHYGEMLDKFLLKDGPERIFVLPNNWYEPLIDAFASQIESKLSIRVSGTRAEILEQLMNHPEIQGFNPSDPKIRSSLASALIDAHRQVRSLAFSSEIHGERWVYENQLQAILLDPEKSEALQRVISDNLAPYMQIWKDYFGLTSLRKKRSLGQRVRESLFNYRETIFPLNVFLAESSSTVLTGAAAYSAFDSAIGALIGGAAGFTAGAMAIVKTNHVLKTKLLSPGLTAAEKTSIENSYNSFARIAAARARTGEHQARFENAWNAWSEFISNPKLSERNLALLDQGRYGRSRELELASVFSSDLLQTGALLRKFHEAELPNGMKFSDLRRFDFELPPEFDASLGSVAERRKGQLETVRAHLEEVEASITRELQTAVAERALFQGSDQRRLQELETAIGLLKVQLEQAHQLTASATQEAWMTDHLLELIRIQK